MNRAGAALVLALLVLLVLEGVVLGSVYLSVQERRIGDNGVTVLRLRLAAESAARAAAATWPAALDSLAAGAVSRETAATSAEGLMLRTVYQRIDSALVLAFAEAAEPPPRAGRARAALLLRPPLLPAGRLPDAAVTAGAAVRLGRRAVLAVTAEPPCPDEARDAARLVDALRLPASELLQRDPGAALEGAVTIADLAPAWSALIAEIARLRSVSADSANPDSTGGSGVIAIDGDYTVRANVTLRGVVLVSGTLSIEAGAVVDGIVLAAGPIHLDGTIRFSACAARAALRAAGLHRPRTYPLRAAVPAF